MLGIDFPDLLPAPCRVSVHSICKLLTDKYVLIPVSFSPLLNIFNSEEKREKLIQKGEKLDMNENN